MRTVYGMYPLTVWSQHPSGNRCTVFATTFRPSSLSHDLSFEVLCVAGHSGQRGRVACDGKKVGYEATGLISKVRFADHVDEPYGLSIKVHRGSLNRDLRPRFLCKRLALIGQGHVSIQGGTAYPSVLDCPVEVRGQVRRGRVGNRSHRHQQYAQHYDASKYERPLQCYCYSLRHFAISPPPSERWIHVA